MVIIIVVGLFVILERKFGLLGKLKNKLSPQGQQNLSTTEDKGMFIHIEIRFKLTRCIILY